MPLKKLFFLLMFVGLLLVNVPLTQGAGLVPAASGDACKIGNATDCGNYTMNDFLVLAINISRWILGLVGSLSLLMFIYGGFMFLISAGSSETVAKAKGIIVAAIIGLTIVFSSFMIIQFVLKSMGIKWTGQAIKNNQIVIPRTTSSLNIKFI